MTILMKYDILTEEQTRSRATRREEKTKKRFRYRFYIAETAIAINSVHKLNYIHRSLFGCFACNSVHKNSNHIHPDPFVRELCWVAKSPLQGFEAR